MDRLQTNTYYIITNGSITPMDKAMIPDGVPVLYVDTTSTTPSEFRFNFGSLISNELSVTETKLRLGHIIPKISEDKLLSM